jgi:hypothetical protein
MTPSHARHTISATVVAPDMCFHAQNLNSSPQRSCRKEKFAVAAAAAAADDLFSHGILH